MKQRKKAQNIFRTVVAMLLVIALLPIYPMNLSAAGTEDPPTTTEKTGKITDLKNLEDGDTIIIYNPSIKKAMSSETVANYYRAGKDVEIENDEVKEPTEDIVWTVGVTETEVDGTSGPTLYTFTDAEGHKLSAGTRNSLPMDDENQDWKIAGASTPDHFYIINSARDTIYAEWHTQQNRFSGYKYVESDEAVYAFELYFGKVAEEDPTSEDPTPEDPTPEDPQPSDPTGLTEGLVENLADLQDGDRVVIVNPAHKKALSSEYTGNYNSGVDVTITDNKVDDPADDIIWTVGITEEEGTKKYSFSTSDGKKLSMASQYSSMPLDEENSAWLVTPAEEANTYFIKNEGRGTYMEWYASKNNWSTYKNNSDTALFAQQFYKIKAPMTEGLVEDIAALEDGDTVVIVNPAHKKALSSEYTGNYNSGVDVTITDNKVDDPADDIIWTVGITEEEGTKKYSFSTSDGKKLSMASQYSSMPLDEENSAWLVTSATEANTYFIQNEGRGTYMEWYASKNNWSTYKNNSDTALFAQQFYKANRPENTPSDGPLNDGDRVVIYNEVAQGVFGESDGAMCENVPATIVDGKADCENGAVIYNVHRDGDAYLFESNGKYLAVNNENDGESITMHDSAEDDVAHRTRFLLEEKDGKYFIISENAKYKTSKVYVEFFSGHFTGWTFNSKNDVGIYLFEFYPVVDGTGEFEGMVNTPKVVFGEEDSVIMNEQFNGIFSLDDLAKDQTEVKATYTTDGETKELTITTENKTDYKYELPVEATKTLDPIVIDVVVTKADGSTYSGQKTITVKDDVLFSDMTPEANSETKEDLKPEIAVTVQNAGEDFTATLKIGQTSVEPKIEGNRLSYKPTEDLKEGRTTVTYTVKRADGKEFAKTWSFSVGEAKEGLYFGQLHAHTQYSDGAGSLDSALEYINNIPESANIDFVAFTDHSNYFDTTSEANPEDALYDMSKATAYSQATWKSYKDSIAAHNAAGGVLALGGFEMTWSGGPGHINTWKTPGIVSRNNKDLNNKTSDAGMKAYYALLSRNEGVDSISQFNHPGNTFGTFSDFAYWDAVIDSRMYLVEVGNGEGPIGQGGYYPSYEYYTMALDKGWHLAPTNNQDNHKGRWGNANDARDVILTDDYSEEGLYKAIQQYRVYATEDKNLEIYYTVNDLPLGTTISEVPEQLNFKVQVADPDASDKITKVELIVNSGVTAYEWSDESEIASGELTATLAPEYSYYYVRVTQSDGNKAVTAPVWVGETLKIGLSNVACDTMMPVTGEELTLTTTVFNSESTPATVKSVTYTTDGSKVLGVDSEPKELAGSSTLEMPFKYTPDKARVMKVTATAVIEQNGKEYTYSKDIELDVSDSEKLVYIGIDASHQNEYIAGNYKDSMGNFSELAASHGVRAVILNTKEDLLKACDSDKFIGLIFTAPSRRNGIQLRDPYNVYDDEEIAAVKKFNKNGGLVVVANWSDYYENYGTFPQDKPQDQMAATQNKLLEALGSSLRVGDDGSLDDTLNGGQSPRLYLNTYNFDNPLLEGVIYDAEHPNDRNYTEVFSHYGGSTIYAVDASGNPTETVPSTVSPVVYGHASTYSADQDKDGFGTKNGAAIPLYANPNGADDKRVLITATEDIEGQGRIVVSGGAFMSNFEVQKQGDSGASDSDGQKNYSNYKICENLLKGFNTVEPAKVEEVRAQTEPGYKFTIEVVVTSNASGHDKDTAFFDCIYGQDETGGICLFPVAGDFKVGDKVRVTGTTDFYQGEPEMQVTSITKISEDNEVVPKDVTSKQITDREVEGQLIKLKGTVESYEEDNGLIQTIMVKDEKGDVARVFIDGYITTSEDVANVKGSEGAEIEVIGLASYDDTFKSPEGPYPRIRIRDRKDITITPKAEEELVPVYRLYNPKTGEHLFTTDEVEKDVLSSDRYKWTYEGIAWYAPKTGTGVYRLFNPKTGQHLYTVDLKEVEVLTTSWGWKKDYNGKPLFYSGGDVAIYRLFNPRNRIGSHHWTTDKVEYDVLPKYGWTQEGLKFNAVKLGDFAK